MYLRRVDRYLRVRELLGRPLFGCGGVWSVLASQGLSSFTNLVAGVAVLRLYEDDHVYGYFSVAMSLYVMVLSVYRAVIAEPMLAGLSDHVDTREVEVFDAVVGGLTFVAVGLTIVTGCVLHVAGFGTGLPIVCLGAVLPFLIVQDHLRHISFVMGDGLAWRYDAVWLFGSALAFVLVSTYGGFILSAPGSSIVGWASGAMVACLAARAGVPWVRRSAWSQWRLRYGRHAGRYLVEFLVERSSFHILSFSFAASAGVVAFGQWRAAQLIFGPLTIVHGGIFSFLVPRLSRQEHGCRRSLVRRAFLYVALTDLVIVALVCGPGYLPLRALLGGGEVGSRFVWLMVGLSVLTWGFAAIGRAVHRASPESRKSARIRVATAALWLVCVPFVTRYQSAAGVGIALLASGTFTALLWIWSAESLLGTERESNDDLVTVRLSVGE